MPLWGTPALIMWLCVFLWFILALEDKHVYKTSTHRGTQKPTMMARRHAAARYSTQHQGTSVELGSSSCCIILFGMLFLFPGSELWCTALRLSSITHTHTHTHAGAFHSSLSQNCFWENSLWQMPQTKRKPEARKEKKQKEKPILAWEKKRVFLSFFLSPPLSMCSFCLLVYNGPLWDDDLPLMVRQTLNNLGNLLSGRVGSEYWYQSAASEQLGLAQRLLAGHNSSVAPSNRSKSRPQ